MMQTESNEKDPAYKITYSEVHSPDYMDGFADGYSRAWRECWQFWIEATQPGIGGGSDEPKPTSEVSE